MTNNEDFGLVVFRPSIYKFFRMARWKNVEKSVLDCGAGGENPPLALFSKHGYDSYGIDISEKQIGLAKEFATRYGLNLKLQKADMRDLPFEDETFGCVYSYNSSIHLTKADTKKAVNEMLRVLQKEGVLCINFLWYNNVDPSVGEEKEQGEFWGEEFGEEAVHSFFTEEETKEILASTKILYSEKIQYDYTFEDWGFHESSFVYVVRKI